MPAVPASGLTRTIYNTIFKKNSVFVATIFTGAIAFEVAFDSTCDKVWDNYNKGKQWKDLKDKYASAE
ncbi:hypothetical protein MFLAVUS_002677 [Mucor flavus]|uniref:Complex III subunit 9 n=1 Tax=Mucor flavus TaxID=439312 RepID=A0ABP9YQZ5_9FUNG